MKMEKRIELEKRGRDPSTIKDLNLDNCKSASVVGLSDEWTDLKSLSMINVGLTSLKSFPKLPSLQKLELSDNWLSGGLEALSGCQKLMYLNLSGNKISDIDTLKPLKEIRTLVSLDLLNCDVSTIEGYRGKVLDLIPSLVYLDGVDKDGNECDDDEEDCEEEGTSQRGVNGPSADDDDDVDDDDDDDLDDELDDEEDDDLDDEDDDEEVGLDAIYSNYDPEGDGDYEAAEEDEEPLDEELEDEEEAAQGSGAKRVNNNACPEAEGAGRGKKRKHEDEEEQK